MQLTRQKPEDRYDYKAVIAAIKAALPGIPVLTDDNNADLLFLSTAQARALARLAADDCEEKDDYK